MARLTEQENWDYGSYTPPPIEHFQELANSATGWIQEVRKHIPEGSDFIELGCAPGYCSAAVGYGKSLQMHGIDFSPSANSYLETLRKIGCRDAALLKEDLLNCRIDRQFSIVASFGLIEHFSGEDLKKILELHDSLTKPGGKIIIEVPNFNGFQGFWHKFFDRDSYKLHNVAVMRPETFDFFITRGYVIEYCSYVGQLRVWGDSGAYTAGGFKTKITRILEKIVNTTAEKLGNVGIILCGRSFSPALLFIAKKS